MSSHVYGVRLMQMLWTWCAFQTDNLSSSVDQLHLLDASSAPKLWAQMRDTTSHTSTSIQKVLQSHMRKSTRESKQQTYLNVGSSPSDGFQAQRRRGRCMRRLNTTTSYSSEERSRGSISRCFFLLFIHIQGVYYTVRIRHSEVA